ncbi:MAG: LysR family transcriptional regulator [Clostridia bacterium]|nr:LysR family transcriptional regulator [Clostridia bacterium]
MNTLHLTYAVEVARCGSITRAAEKLYMAQPNLSKALHELEEQMGFAIFRRTSRGVTPTPRGQEFLDCARGLLAQLRSMERLSARSDDAMQRFSLSMAGAGYLRQAMARWTASLDPSAPLDVSVREGGDLDAVQDVAEGLALLGVARYAATEEDAFFALLRQQSLESQPLAAFEALATFSAASPLAQQDSVSRDELRSLTALSPAPLPAGEGEAPRRLCLRGQLNCLELLSGMPEAFLWAPPEPDETLRRYGLVQRRCAQGGPRFCDALVFPRGHGFSQLEQRFIALAQESAGG